MWTIEPSSRNHRIVITFKGQFEQRHDKFDTQMMAAVARVKSRKGQFDTLTNMLEAPVAPQGQASRGGDIARWCLANGLRKSAVVHSSQTGIMQMRRLVNNDERAAYFSSLPDAEAWLDE
jgi:hypothetical protein